MFVFLSFESTQDIGGLLCFIAIVLTIIFAVKSKNHKKSPVALPESISENGKRYDLAYQYNNVTIVGREYHQDIKIFKGNKLIVLQEPNNPYDNAAVSINVERNGLTVLAGYIGRDSNIKTMVNDYFRRGQKVIAFAENADKMTIGFYK